MRLITPFSILGMILTYPKENFHLRSIVISSITQLLYEHCHVYQPFHARYPDIPFVLTGGCTLNCPSNTKAFDLHESILFDPCCNDEGLSTGASLCLSDLVISSKGNTLSPPPILDPRRGSLLADCLTIQEIQDLFPELSVLDITNSFPYEHVLSFLDRNMIGAFAINHYEIGPRALCNRSIIGRADVAENHFLINSIKSREPWRPLAPVTIPDFYPHYFEGPMNDFMLTFSKVISSKLPAISHVDNTARVQILRHKDHPVYQLLEAVNSYRNFPPVFINTSLNGKNQPIINSMVDLLSFLLDTQLHYIVTDKYLIAKSCL